MGREVKRVWQFTRKRQKGAVIDALFCFALIDQCSPCHCDVRYDAILNLKLYPRWIDQMIK